jgi:Na+-translocating ferredoxin:NAD+ oxidoreductase RNF subunit RnfB
MGQQMEEEKDLSSVDESCLIPEVMIWQKTPEYHSILRLDADRGVAMRKLADIESLSETLPGIDCGSCGAPTCHALAEDIVNGTAHERDCVFKLRERMSSLFHEMAELQEYMPPPFREQGIGDRE